MDNNKALNEFVQQYYGQLASLVYKDPVKLSSKETALVIIDAQKCVTKEYFIEGYKALGVDTEPLMPVLNQLEENTQAALANIQRILYKCREVGITPMQETLDVCMHLQGCIIHREAWHLSFAMR